VSQKRKIFEMRLMPVIGAISIFLFSTMAFTQWGIAALATHCKCRAQTHVPDIHAAAKRGPA
jgi:hypothetical protein